MPVLIEQLIPWNRRPPPGTPIDPLYLTLGLHSLFVLTPEHGYKELLKGGAVVFAGSNTKTPFGVVTGGTASDSITLHTNKVRGNPHTIVAVNKYTSGSVMWSSMPGGGTLWDGPYGGGNGNITTSNDNSFDGGLSFDSARAPHGLDQVAYSVGPAANSLRGYRNGGSYREDVTCVLPDVCSYIVLGGAYHTQYDNTSVGLHELYAVFDQELPKGLLQSLSRNPWQLFAPQVEYIPAPVATSSPQFDSASNSGYQAAQTTYSWLHTCSGSDRFLRVSFAKQDSFPGRAITSLTYNGVALAAILTSSTGTGIGVKEYILVAPSVGTNTITVTFEGAIDSIGFATSYSGVNQSTPYESSVGAYSNVGGADATVTITSITDMCLIVGTVVSDDLSITTGAGQTSRGIVSGALFSGASSEEGPKTPAGAVTFSYADNVASTKWAIVGYALRPATALSSLFADSDLRYSILAALQADSDQRWSVLNSANADSTTQWSLLNAALADSDQRWSALNAAQGDSSQQWSILSAALADSDVRWSLLNALQSDSTLQWSVLNAILADTDQRWSVLAGVFTDSDLRWDLQSALSAVFADSDQRWSILSAVLNDADLRHSILNAVNADSDQRWSIVNAAQADGTYQWSLVAAIQNDSSLIWDLQSALAAVFQDSTLQWSLVAAIQQQLDAQWSLLNAVQIDADARWSIANAVAQDLTAQWSALGAAYKDATIQWSSLAISETTAALSWSIQSEAAPVKIISIVFSTKTRSIVFSAKPN